MIFVKSKEEIVYVKKAAGLAAKALDEVWKYAKAGESESKILAEMNRVIFEGGGDYPANEFVIGSGGNALLCRYQAEKRNLSNHDQLTVEWAGTYRHYHSAMFRTIPIGKADPTHYKMDEACVEVLKKCEDKHFMEWFLHKKNNSPQTHKIFGTYLALGQIIWKLFVLR